MDDVGTGVDDNVEPGDDEAFGPLDDEQARVVGCLIEKGMTTPDQYPMSLNGVTLAANQRSNRDPVVDFSESLVSRTLRELSDRGIVRMVHRPGDRVVKYRHVLDEHLAVGDQQIALLAVLLLRGAQTPGELRQRTQRYVEFATLAELEATLEGLAGQGLVVRLERQPGQKESRYLEQISTRGQSGGDGQAAVAPAPASAAEPGELDALKAEVAELTRRFETLLDQLGVDDV